MRIEMEKKWYSYQQDGAILTAAEVIGRQINNVKISIDDIPTVNISPLVKSTVEIDCIYSDYIKVSKKLDILEK